jgi:hypothetical protein
VTTEILIFVPGKLWTTNGERSMHRHQRSVKTRYWRAAFADEAAEFAPVLCRVRVIAQPYQRLGRLGDAGGHLPVVKAAIDGLRDAGVLIDDDGRYVTSLEMLAPLRGEAEGLMLRLEEVA